MTTESRKPRDVRGHMLPLRFKVIDQRPPVAGALSAAEAAAEAEARKQRIKAGKDADDEEVGGGGGGGGKKEKHKAPAGRGPYKVSIMLTGACVCALVGSYGVWLVGISLVASRKVDGFRQGHASHTRLRRTARPPRRRGHTGDERGGAPSDWHGRRAQRHRRLHHGDPLPPLPLHRNHQVRARGRGRLGGWASPRVRCANHPNRSPPAALDPALLLPTHRCHRVEMRDETRLLFVDEFSLSFHIHFYRLLKWLVAAPFAAAAAAVLAYRPGGDDALA